MTESSLNNISIVADSITTCVQLNTSSTSNSISSQSVSNQLIKSNVSSSNAIANNSFFGTNSTKNMIENVENFCDPNWANSGFQHMEGKVVNVSRFKTNIERF
jgi:hypothetical protein